MQAVGRQQAEQRVGWIHRAPISRVRVQVQEELPIGKPVGEQMGGVNRESRLAHAGHAVDGVDGNDAVPSHGTGHHFHDLFELTGTPGERRGVPQQGVRYPDRSVDDRLLDDVLVPGGLVDAITA